MSMLSLAPKPRELRLSGFQLLSVPSVKTHTWNHAFSVVTSWNTLTEHIKSSHTMVSFRHHLKTHLFRLGYPS